MDDGHSIADTDTRREWVEPELYELKISDTASQPLTGTDGGTYSDCTRS